ncbi:MAG: SynChlorMet cassette radical SAM/SPASM protein ScmE [Anaerolineales bacterium]|nr:SynChlorMet cassette radical SAM/SPASM protein ScmE [Anaerolineales bacterium]
MSDRSFLSTPKSVGIAITGRCNLRCRYCYYAGEMAALSDLPTERWLAFFDELGQLGVMDVTLTGGEAFTRPDLFTLIDGLIANRMRYCILSNGTLIDEALLAQFEVGKRRLRLNYIQISIDGASAEVHDRSRPNSFARALRGLKLLKSAGFPVVVRVTINRYNLHDLDNIAHLLLEEIGLPSFGTNEAFPMGAGCQNREQVSLTSLEKLEAMEMIERLLERYPGRISGTAGPVANRRAYAEMEHARRTGEKTSRWGMGYLTACGCVFSKIDILHDGSVVPCHILSGVVVGNILTDSLVDIWNHNPQMQALRQRRAIPMRQLPTCEDCEWAEYCNGGCPGLAYELTGDFNRANPEDCYRRFLLETK